MVDRNKAFIKLKVGPINYKVIKLIRNDKFYCRVMYLSVYARGGRVISPIPLREHWPIIECLCSLRLGI